MQWAANGTYAFYRNIPKPGLLIAKAEAVDSPPRVELDMDLIEIPVYGPQEQSAYNGHFEFGRIPGPSEKENGLD